MPSLLYALYNVKLKKYVVFQFGIMSCTLNTDSHCRLVAHNEPTILFQNGTDRHIYSGDADKDQIVEFVQLIKESAGKCVFKF